MSKSMWINFRDHMTALFSNAAHAAAPIAEQALITAGKAVATAAMSGTAHNSQEMLDVALKSLKEQAPTLGVSVTAAIAASAVHDAAIAQGQAPAPQ